jgi:hypothetical protein
MNRGGWTVAFAKAFAVVTLSVGVGLLAGAIAFTATGVQGNLNGPLFGHIADVVGWGAGFVTASLSTIVLLWMGGRRPGAPEAKKDAIGMRDEL